MISRGHIISFGILIVVVSLVALYLKVDGQVAFAIVAGLVSAWMFLFVFRRFTPVLTVRINPHWVDSFQRMVIIRVTIDNAGRVAAFKRDASVQILEYRPPARGQLYSEWVPLSEDSIRAPESPLVWNDKRDFLITTEKVEAGESIHVDLLYHCPEETVAHFLVQFTAKLNPVTKWLHRSPGDSWTATAWLVAPVADLCR